jgi:hypothetical protein
MRGIGVKQTPHEFSARGRMTQLAVRYDLLADLYDLFPPIEAGAKSHTK